MLFILFMLHTSLQAISLTGAASSALDNDPSLHHAAHELRAAQYQTLSSYGEFLPKINLEGTRNFQEKSLLSGKKKNFNQASISAQQTLLDFEQSAQITQHQQQEQLQKLNTMENQQSVLLSVTEQYLSLLSYLDTRSILLNQSQTLSHQKRKVTLGIKEGINTKRDTLAIDASIAQVQAQLLSINQSMKQTQQTLSMQINNNVDAIDALAHEPNLTQLPKDNPHSGPILALEQAQRHMEVSDQTARSVRQKLLPTLSAHATKNMTKDYSDSYKVGLTLGLSVTSPQITNALAAHQKAVADRWLYLDQKRHILDEIQQLKNKASHLNEQLKADKKAHMAQNEATKVQVKSYQNQLISVIDYLQSIDKRSETAIQVRQTFYQAWQNHFALLAHHNALSISSLKQLQKSLQMTVRLK